MIAPPRTSVSERVLRVLVPIVMLVLPVAVWWIYVVATHQPKYILPSPADVWEAFRLDLVSKDGSLLKSLWVTLSITFEALVLALIGGVGLAIVLIQSRWIELALYPFAVILQVTPIVA